MKECTKCRQRGRRLNRDERGWCQRCRSEEAIAARQRAVDEQRAAEAAREAPVQVELTGAQRYLLLSLVREWHRTLLPRSVARVGNDLPVRMNIGEGWLEEVRSESEMLQELEELLDPIPF